mmetsp:Transcript_42917/g.134683  ORF Transcript_42917/g.134683 Transcript_42917/m.134683 type:complete len:108 (-) Transcript_42917:323-646(-)
MATNVGADADAEAERQVRWMREAVAEGERALALGEVPVGCVYVGDGGVLARGHNLTNVGKDASRHAELVAADTVLLKAGGGEVRRRLMLRLRLMRWTTRRCAAASCT